LEFHNPNTEQAKVSYDFASPIIRSLIYDTAAPTTGKGLVDCPNILKPGTEGLEGCVQFLEAYLRHLASDKKAQKALQAVRKHNQIQPASDLPAEYQYHFEMFHFARSQQRYSDPFVVIPEHTVQGSKKRVEIRWINCNKVGFELCCMVSVLLLLLLLLFHSYLFF
jgi:hypothetical protein